MLADQDFSSLFNDKHTVKYIDVKRSVLEEYELSTRNFMILGVAFNIAQWLDFIGYYLPIARSGNVRVFQEITNYFAQFDQGIERVNMYRAMMEFDRS